MKDMLKLINDYQSAVKSGVEAMQRQFNTKHLLSGWNRKTIPQNGVLSSGIEYDFHGIGCIVTAR